MHAVAYAITQDTALTYLVNKPGCVLQFLQLPFVRSVVEGELVAEKKAGQPFTVCYQSGTGLWMIYANEDKSDKIIFTTIEQIVEYITRIWW
jgi:hypothetical protein